MATFIYPKYYENVSGGVINPNNVNFSAYVVDNSYVPAETHTKTKVTGRIETLSKILVKGDIATLTMSGIIDKVWNQLEEDEKKTAYAFVAYDIASGDLCWHETFDKVITE